MEYELLVGTDSTWSIRALLCLKMVGIEPKVTVFDLTSSNYKEKLRLRSETGLVPVLFSDSGTVYDSLAIVEHVNEISGGRLYPKSTEERAIARSMCSELHSGFLTLRTQCPFTLEPRSTPTLSNELENEISRLQFIWSKSQGSFMFGTPSAVDAFYAVLAYRLSTYQIKLVGQAKKYQDSLLSWPLFLDVMESVSQW